MLVWKVESLSPAFSFVDETIVSSLIKWQHGLYTHIALNPRHELVFSPLPILPVGLLVVVLRTLSVTKPSCQQSQGCTIRRTQSRYSAQRTSKSGPPTK